MQHDISTQPTSAASHAVMLRMAGERAGARLLEPVRGVLRHRPAAVRVQRLAQHMPAPLRHVRARAEDICRGRWLLAGSEVYAQGEVIFDRHDTPRDWLRALHGFDWIFTLLNGEKRLWRLMARTLVLDWLDRLRRRTLPRQAQQAPVLARRLVNLCAAAPLLLHGAQDTFAARLLAGLAQQWRTVQATPTAGLTALDRLEVMMARAFAALALSDNLQIRTQALVALAEELERQFLPDGGHVSRAPLVLLDVLGTLLPLRQTVEMAGLEVPATMEQVAEKALPMLRMLRHADGSLALFHGARHTGRAWLARLLETYDTTGGAPLDLAPHAGFARLTGGNSVLLADVGAPPLPWHNPAGALSPLAIEFSSAGQRIFTSCGAPLREMPELDEAARMSAAHCTPVLGEGDAGKLHDSLLGRWLLGAPMAEGPCVSARLERAAPGMLLQAEHDGWRKTHGMMAQRRLFLATDGADLRGEDAFEPLQVPGGQVELPFTIRFHLHPAVKASMARDGLSVMLMLPDRSGWSFSARNARLALEESILMAGENGPRRSTQIVLHGICPAIGCTVNWRLKKISATSSRRRSPRKASTQTPALPLD